jgi:outer membrane protein assembly factor BamB
MVILGAGVLLAGLLCAPTGRAGPAEDDAKAAIEASGIRGGLAVHVGAGDGRLTAALRSGGRFQVQGLDADPKRVTAAREAVRAAGAYGEVSVDRLDGASLPYVDGLVNLVVLDDAAAVPMAEAMRVLAPNGAAVVRKDGRWTRTVKPRPAGLDDWTHYYYDARGNAVSKDTEIGPPERLQWVGGPRWSRHHDRMSSLSAQVSCNGRLVYVIDEGSRISILLPSKWVLMARDAFNGTILWKKSIEKWNTNLWPLKSGPTQLTRRLVGVGDRIFVTLGLGEPVSCLDAATGGPIRVYADTKGAEEILYVDGTLYVLVNPGAWQLAEFAPKHNTGDQKRVETEYNWDEKARVLVAVDAATGRMLWRVEDRIAPLTMAADGRQVVYHDGASLVCLDPKTGAKRWTSEPVTKRKLFEFNYGPRLLLHGETVLYAGGDGAMVGIDAASGRRLWQAPHEKSGYRSPEDLIVAGGLVWNAGTLSGSQSGEFKGRDPRTGEVVKQFAPDVECYWFHHRCYLSKATEKYILVSRTGIEFVDHAASHWDINHWVRGACLYGVLPANGLVYAGPHNCACYPEAKLDGMNALAPAGATTKVVPPPDAQRLEHGPAWGRPVDETAADPKDWPTYRHDAARSGFSDQALAEDLGRAWDADLGGPLSAPTIAGGRVYVAQVDAHTLHAIDAATGARLWHFTAGARIDSPPTFWKGRLLFGGKDGWVYCLRADDGAMVWRFRAAPGPQRHAAWEQLESVWPVHGSVLVEDGVVSCVAGRSMFLDGGLRFLRLDAATGRKLVEVVYDSRDPETGADLQLRHKTLQMPVGLNDILSSDGRHIYLRSQKILADGTRVDIGPISGNAAEQGAAQKGEGAHLFAPMGFLDDSWFHRSYWVYGKSFAGGHNGYYQAGKYTPSGRILVHNDTTVYGFGREPQYLKWTTTMEHRLFAASRVAPDVEPPPDAGPKRKGKAAPAAAPAGGPGVKFPDADRLDPAGKPLTVEAWVQSPGGDGVVVSHGGPQAGYSLYLTGGAPTFAVRAEKTLAVAEGKEPIGEGWHHLAAVLGDDKSMRLFVDGRLVGEARAAGMLARPKQPMEIGNDSAGGVGDYAREFPFVGQIDEVVVHHRALDGEEINRRMAAADARSVRGAALACTFDGGKAVDAGGSDVAGVVTGATVGKGRTGDALEFGRKPAAVAAKGGAGKAQGSYVQCDWSGKVPIITRAMAMAGRKILIAGPPDVVDEEYAFERLTQRDATVQESLDEQDAALEGKRGGIMQLIDAETGEPSGEFKLDQPPVWDGLAVARGRLYVCTQDGKVQCYGKPE